jgi:ribose transport system substrate-binding protein
MIVPLRIARRRGGAGPGSTVPIGARSSPLRVMVMALLLVTAACSTGTSDSPTDSTISTGTSSSTPASNPTGTSGPHRRIGVVAPETTDPFSAAVVDSVADEAKRVGVELVRCDSGGDAGNILQCARQMAAEEVDGWIVVSPNQASAALCDVGPPKVPLFVVGSTASVSCAVGAVNIDSAQTGRSLGQELGRLAQTDNACETDQFVIVTDVAANSASATRAVGIRAGIHGECPAADLTQVDVATASRPDNAVSAALVAKPGSTGILVAAADDRSALLVVAAVPEKDRHLVRLAAIGLDQRARCQIAENDLWYGDVALFPDRYGAMIVPPLLKAIGGGGPSVVEVPTAFVTRSNLAQYYDTKDCGTQ